MIVENEAKREGTGQKRCAHSCSCLQERLKPQKRSSSSRLLPGMVTGISEYLLYPLHELDPGFL